MANLSKSNASHRRLANVSRKKLALSNSMADIEKYQVLKGYHEEVAVCQSRIGRVLTKSERKKAFSIMQKHSGNADIRGLFHK